MKMFFSLLVLLFSVTCLFPSMVCGAHEVSASAGKSNKKHPQKVAMEQWAHYLNPSRDYVPEQWKILFHSRSESTFFNEYAMILSKLFKQNRAKVNFAMIGACDGTADRTIRDVFLTQDHWRGVFVEPVEMNVRDLVSYMAHHNVSQRSMVIRAAATLQCASPTISFERPLYEEKNKSVPHWLRRQIGSIVPSHRDHARKEWTLETVRCVTASDILADWARGVAAATVMATADPSSSTPISLHQIKRRPHVLKIDAEGHDYEVLMSFVQKGTPRSQLPLLIEFEAKSIDKKFPAAKSHMESMGYVVSDFGQDGFALLKADFIFD